MIISFSDFHKNNLMEISVGFEKYFLIVPGNKFFSGPNTLSPIYPRQ